MVWGWRSETQYTLLAKGEGKLKPLVALEGRILLFSLEEAAELLEDGDCGVFVFFEHCDAKLSIAMLLFEPPFPFVLENT